MGMTGLGFMPSSVPSNEDVKSPGQYLSMAKEGEIVDVPWADKEIRQLREFKQDMVQLLGTAVGKLEDRAQVIEQCLISHCHDGIDARAGSKGLSRSRNDAVRVPIQDRSCSAARSQVQAGQSPSAASKLGTKNNTGPTISVAKGD